MCVCVCVRIYTYYSQYTGHYNSGNKLYTSDI